MVSNALFPSHRRILALLETREWVTTSEICTRAVGGTNGTARVRELRAEHGYDIECRRKPGSPDWEYTLHGRKPVAGRLW